MTNNKPEFRKIHTLSTSVELPTLKSNTTKFVARVFFKNCDRLPESWVNYYSSCSDIQFNRISWDKEQLKDLMKGAILVPLQKEQILSHDSYAELTREIDGTPEGKAASAFWDMIKPMAGLYENAVGIQFMSLVYPRFYRTAFFNSLNLVGTNFSLSENNCLIYTSIGLQDFGVHEVEYVLPKEQHCDFDCAQTTWMSARTTEDMLTQVMSEESAYIRLILPFRSILDRMLLNRFPLESGIYQDSNYKKNTYKIEQCVLSTGKTGIRITTLPNH